MSEEKSEDRAGPVPREELVGERIKLIRYRPEHVEGVYEIVMESQAELIEWTSWCHPDYSIDETRDFAARREEEWQNGKSYIFLMLDRKTGDPLGTCGLASVDPVNKLANLGYWVRTSRTGEGIAPEASRLLLDFAFSDAGLVRVEILASAANARSLRVIGKIGAVKEGVLRKRLFLNGRSHDAVMHSVTIDDKAPGKFG